MSEQEERQPDKAEVAEGGSHHHSSHHHHHSRHHHRSKSKRKKNKFTKLIAEHKKQAAAVAVFILLIIGLLVFMIVENKIRQEPQPDPSSSGDIGAFLRIDVPLFPDEAVLIREGAQAYLSADSSAPVSDVLAPYRESGLRQDVGLPVEIRFDVLSVTESGVVTSSRIEVAEDPSFTEARVFDLAAGQYSAEVYHLKTGTQYHYRITVNLSNGTSTGILGSFKTVDTPRMLHIDGLVNVRDIGGWKTSEGKTIRQGLLYRGSELDGAVDERYRITEAGVQDMLTVLGVQTEMDLRAAAEGFDALGANVEHIYYGASMYENIFTDAGKAAVRAIFADLSDPANYPVYLHCTYGADRTGTVCYLLEALLGVSEEDLIREYELSAMIHTDMSRSALTAMIDTLKGYGGGSMQENVERYLLSVGVTGEQIASLRAIYLE